MHFIPFLSLFIPLYIFTFFFCTLLQSLYFIVLSCFNVPSFSLSLYVYISWSTLCIIVIFCSYSTPPPPLSLSVPSSLICSLCLRLSICLVCLSVRLCLSLYLPLPLTSYFQPPSHLIKRHPGISSRVTSQAYLHGPLMKGKPSQCTQPLIMKAARLAESCGLQQETRQPTQLPTRNVHLPTSETERTNKCERQSCSSRRPQ